MFTIFRNLDLKKFNHFWAILNHAFFVLCFFEFAQRYKIILTNLKLITKNFLHYFRLPY